MVRFCLLVPKVASAVYFSAISSSGARVAVEEIIGTNAAKKLRCATAHLSDQNFDAVSGEVWIEKLPGGDVSLSSPTRNGMLELFASRHLIQWTSRKEACDNWGQTGDSRAFYRCHAPVKRIHNLVQYHDGYLLQVHGRRDSTEKILSRGKKTIEVLAPVCLATGAIVTAAITIAAPNPVTGAAALHLAHLTIASVTLGSAGTYIEALASISNRSSKSMPDYLLGPKQMSPDEVEAILDPFKDKMTLKGKCSECGQDAFSSQGCMYIWTCCVRILCVWDTEEEISYSLGVRCKRKFSQCNDVKPVGCIRRCESCDTTDNGEGFLKDGCGESNHVLAPIRSMSKPVFYKS